MKPKQFKYAQPIKDFPFPGKVLSEAAKQKSASRTFAFKEHSDKSREELLELLIEAHISAERLAAHTERDYNAICALYRDIFQRNSTPDGNGALYVDWMCDLIGERFHALEEKLAEWIQPCFCRGALQCLMCETRELLVNKEGGQP